MCYAFRNFTILTQNECDSVNFRDEVVFGDCKIWKNFYTVESKICSTKTYAKVNLFSSFSVNYNLKKDWTYFPSKRRKFKPWQSKKSPWNQQKRPHGRLKMFCYSVLFWRIRRFFTVLKLVLCVIPSITFCVIRSPF